MKETLRVKPSYGEASEKKRDKLLGHIWKHTGLVYTMTTKNSGGEQC